MSNPQPGRRYLAGHHLHCPACDGQLGTAISEHNDKARAPLHNDATVCSHCLIYLRYEETMEGLQLRVIEREEFEGLAERYQAALMQTRAKLQAAGAGRIGAPPLAAVMANEIAKLKRRVGRLETAGCGCYYCKSGDSLNCTYRRTA
jgi:hypothetical protein